MKHLYVIWNDVEGNLIDRKLSLSSNIITQAIQILTTSHLSFLDWDIKPVTEGESLPVEPFWSVKMTDFVVGSTSKILVNPYSNLLTTMKMKEEKTRSFSYQIWHLNRSIYQNTGITVGEISDKQNWVKLGFNRTMLVEEMCNKHLRQLAL